MIGNTISARYRVLAFQASGRWLNINCHLHKSNRSRYMRVPSG